MRALDPEIHVLGFLLAHPGAFGVFERLGVDYVALGERSLREAALCTGIELEPLLRELEAASLDHGGSSVAKLEGLLALIDHIASDTDRATREARAALPRLVAEVLTADRVSFPEAEKLAEIALELLAELEAHREREEGLLFPYLRALVEASASGDRLSRPTFETAARPILVMRSDHDATRTLLRELASLTGDYELPAVASPALRELYAQLVRQAALVSRHVWLEEELLYPQVLELEERMQG